MLESFVERENAVFSALQAFEAEGLDFVLVGGYAVSAFRHRYSIDADIVINSADLEKFSVILEKLGYRKHAEKKLEAYGGEFQQWLQEAKRMPTTVDLLVNALISRQTNAAWSLDYLKKFSSKRKVEGIEKAVFVLVPEKELLIALKLHAARLTDTRDAVALAEEINVEKVVTHALRGNQKKLAKILRAVEKELKKPQFSDSFKGVFETKKFNEKTIKQVQLIIQQLEKQIAEAF
ncbi:MAG: hypothetical protein ACE5DI_00340 [Candidatus Micrarchaeia archaeon]